LALQRKDGIDHKPSNAKEKGRSLRTISLISLTFRAKSPG
jgi:hypothetical protein